MCWVLGSQDLDPAFREVTDKETEITSVKRWERCLTAPEFWCCFLRLTTMATLGVHISRNPILYMRKLKLKMVPNHVQGPTINSGLGMKHPLRAQGPDCAEAWIFRGEGSVGELQGASMASGIFFSVCPPCLPFPSLSSLQTCRAEADCLLGVLSPLLLSLLSPQGWWGPHSSLARSGPLVCLRSPPHPHHAAWTAERCRLVRATGEPDPASKFLPPCLNKSRAASGSPGVPVPLPAQFLWRLTGPNLSCLHAASPPSLGSPDANTF